MLAYAARVPRHAERGSSPNAMLAIIAGHVALIAIVMSARMDLPQKLIDRPIDITWIDPVEPPPPNPPIRHVTRPQPGPTVTDPITPVPPSPGPVVSQTLPIPDPGPFIGSSIDPMPQPRPTPPLLRLEPQLVTPPAELRPPYPPAKLASGEEAVLKLRLSIDERGRVVAVEPVGRADRAFLDSARRYLLAHWRYRPASEDGRAVAAFTVVTLRFQLDG
jgi:protein TonB